jgi:hypothetical protein
LGRSGIARCLAPLGSLIEELGQPLDGLARTQGSCHLMTANINTLRMHIKEKHDVPWRGDTAALYAKVKVQTFFYPRALNPVL